MQMPVGNVLIVEDDPDTRLMIAAMLLTPETSVCNTSQRKLTRISPQNPAGNWCE